MTKENYINNYINATEDYKALMASLHTADDIRANNDAIEAAIDRIMQARYDIFNYVPKFISHLPETWDGFMR